MIPVGEDLSSSPLDNALSVGTSTINHDTGTPAIIAYNMPSGGSGSTQIFYADLKADSSCPGPLSANELSFNFCQNADLTAGSATQSMDFVVGRAVTTSDFQRAVNVWGEDASGNDDLSPA